MHPLVRALFSAWDFRLDVSIVLLIFATLYTVGWLRLRRRQSSAKLANKRKLVAYWSGLLVLAIALMSPIDILGSQLLFMHMIQHKLEVMIAPPLLWLAAPFPFLVWGLPESLRKRVTMFFAGESPFRRLLSTVTAPGIAWFAFIAVYMGWHDPGFYDLALYHDWVHDLQHLSFFLTAMLFWWHIVGAAPHIHGGTAVWGRLAMVIGVIPAQMIAGIIIATATTVLYPYYESVPRFWGVSVLADQGIAGAIMWIPSSEMMVWAVVFLLSSLFNNKDKPASLANADWDNAATMVAPGLEQRVVQQRWREIAEARVQARHST